MTTLRPEVDGLLDLDRLRADDRRRSGVGDHVQRRPPRRPAVGDARSAAARWRPCCAMSMAYPLASRFRTGTTLAMFTLVVFTLVTGSATSGSFMHAALDERDVRRRLRRARRHRGASPIHDMRAAIDRSQLAAGGGLSGGRQPVGAGRVGTPARHRQGVPRTTWYAASTVRSSTTPRSASAPWPRATAPPARCGTRMRDRPRLAVVDTSIVPAARQFRLQRRAPRPPAAGLLRRRETFGPVPLDGADAQTGRRVRLTVIGILKDSAPLEMAGISTSQRTLDAAFPGRVRPTIHYFRVAPGVDPEDAAARLESAFLANGHRRRSRSTTSVHDATAASLVFNRLILGFMGLGLVVGVAALGVISARVGGRAAAADRRAAGDRLPARDGAGRLPARVVADRGHARSCSGRCSGSSWRTTSSPTSSGCPAGRT